MSYRVVVWNEAWDVDGPDFEGYGWHETRADADAHARDLNEIFEGRVAVIDYRKLLLEVTNEPA
jgi:hypothetical protein